MIGFSLVVMIAIALFGRDSQFLDAFAPGSIHLVLELTERKLIEPTAITHQLFEQLHDLGVMIAIDD